MHMRSQSVTAKEATQPSQPTVKNKYYGALGIFRSPLNGSTDTLKKGSKLSQTELEQKLMRELAERAELTERLNKARQQMKKERREFQAKYGL